MIAHDLISYVDKKKRNLAKTKKMMNDEKSAFELSLEKVKMFKNFEAFFAFCGAILGINHISFDNIKQWMNEIRT